MNLTTKEEIKNWLDYYHIVDYQIKDNLEVNVLNSVSISGHEELCEIPFQFNYVRGNFDLPHNKLSSLKGSPRKVGGGLYLPDNQLTTFDYLPESIGDSIDIANNKITSLKGLPESVDGGLYLSGNPITSFEYCPLKVSGIIFADCDEITSLKYLPKKIHELVVASKKLNSLENDIESIATKIILNVRSFDSKVGFEDIMSDSFNVNLSLSDLKNIELFRKMYFESQNNNYKNETKIKL